MLKRLSYQGLGIVEVIISTAVAAIVITTLFTFVVRSFTPPRQQYEQGKITEEARLQLNRISDAVRNAVEVDFNGNGVIDSISRQEQWLQYGGDYEMTFYTLRDVGGTDRLEQIRYWLESNELKMEIKAVNSGACLVTDSSLTVARGVRNVTESVPLFSYYSSSTKMFTPVVSPRSVKRVQLELVIDTDLQQLPEAARIRTEITPRKGMYAVALVGTPAACNDCIDNDLDGRVDVGGILNTLADPGCSTTSDTSEKGDLECDDGFDNDTDTKIDYQIYNRGDITCTSPSGTSEGPTPSPAPTPTPSPTCDSSSVSSLTGYWKFDEGSGMTTADGSGEGHPGTLVNNPTWNTQPPTTAFANPASLSFVADDYVDMDVTFPSLMSPHSGTIAVWLKPTGTAANANGGNFWENEHVVTQDFSTNLGILRGHGSDGTALLDRIWMVNWDGDHDLIGIPYTHDEWTHVAWVHKAGRLYAYKNGVLVDSVASGATAGMTQELRVGRASQGTAYQGALDDLRIYNRPLATEEIAELAAGACTTTPVACVPGETFGTPQCSDGADNDCDGQFDYPADNHCSDAFSTNEASTSHQCNDNFDNDSDGGIDFLGSPKDAECASSGDKSEFQVGQQN